MGMLLQQAAQQYRPEDRERFVEYVRSEPMAQAQLRAPLYEDKVVDFLFSKAEVSEREVTRAELEAAIEAEDTAPRAGPEEGRGGRGRGKEGPGEGRDGEGSGQEAAPRPRPRSRPRRRPRPRRPLPS
jgi:trigger factor